MITLFMLRPNIYFKSLDNAITYAENLAKLEIEKLSKPQLNAYHFSHRPNRFLKATQAFSRVDNAIFRWDSIFENENGKYHRLSITGDEYVKYSRTVKRVIFPEVKIVGQPYVAEVSESVEDIIQDWVYLRPKSEPSYIIEEKTIHFKDEENE